MNKKMNREHYEQLGVAMTCRSFEEYSAMFGVGKKDVQGLRIADAAAGASSFTAAARAAGADSYAFDPRYGEPLASWEASAREEIELSTAKLEALKGRYDWSFYGDLDNHKRNRLSSLAICAADRSSDLSEKRYIAALLPKIPAPDHSFDLVFCSHFLFLYAEQFGFDFHRSSLLELMRICRPGGRVLVYPLLSLRSQRFEQMDMLLQAVRSAGGEPSFHPSHLPFLPQSAERLEIKIPALEKGNR